MLHKIKQTSIINLYLKIIALKLVYSVKLLIQKLTLLFILNVLIEKFLKIL